MVLQLYQENKDWDAVSRKIDAKINDRQWNDYSARSPKSCSQKYAREKDALKTEIMKYKEKLTEKWNNHALKRNQKLELLIGVEIVAIATVADDHDYTSSLLFTCHSRNYKCNQYVKVSIQSITDKHEQLSLPDTIQTDEFKIVKDLAPGTFIPYPLSDINIVKTLDLYTPSTEILQIIWEIERNNRAFVLSTDNLNADAGIQVTNLVERELSETERRTNAIQENVQIQRAHTIQHMTFYRNCEKWNETLDKMVETFDVATELLRQLQQQGKKVKINFKGKVKVCKVPNYKTLYVVAYQFVTKLELFTSANLEILNSEGEVIDDEFSFDSLDNDVSLFVQEESQ